MTKPKPVTRPRTYLVGGAAIVIALLTWFWGDIAAYLTQKPQVTEILGSWRFDEEAFQRLASAGTPPGPDRERNEARLRSLSERYRGVTYTFE
ncbi:MAG: hypothetical protein H0W72_16515, partial [Planctomycetes bacterium]|nr:hypothetical protein [Planctomycetota bacterium]